MTQPKFKIFSVFHKPFAIPDYDFIKPIHAGKSLGKIDLKIEGDDIGENISDLNTKFCELTVLYNIWKNKKFESFDYWGLCHYRRYFCLQMHWTRIKKKSIYFFKEDKVDYSKIVSEKWVQYVNKSLEKNTIILPIAVSLDNYHGKSITLKEHYIQEHEKLGWDVLISTLLHLYPDYSKTVEEVSNQKYLYCYNMMIAHKDIWDEYLNWLFAILFKVNEIYTSPTDAYQSRAIGFMAERLLNIYIRHHNFKIIEMPIVAIM